MTPTPCPIGFADLVDYWTGDAPGETAERVEAHVFACADCARLLADVEALGSAVAAVVRKGRFHSAITEDVLNRLARDGVRIRTYTLHPGDVVPCAVWAGDDLVVTRLRGDFTGLDSLTVVTRLASGEEVGRLADVPVPRGSEVLDAVSAALLRQLPAATIQVTVTGRTGDGERSIGTYTLEHAGALDGEDAQ